MADLTIGLYALADLDDAVTGIASARRPSWHEELSEAGFASLVLQSDDPVNNLIVMPNTLIGFDVDSNRAFTMLVERFTAVDIDPGEEAAQITTYDGRGLPALCDRLVVHPALGIGKKPIEEDRALNWTDPAYDDSAWSTATAIDTVAGAQASWGGGGNTWDADFPDNTVDVLGPSTATTTTALPGECYIRQPITVGADGVYRLSGLMDNYGEIYVDSVLVLSIGQTQDGTMTAFQTTVAATVELTAGTHTVALRVVNFPISGNNPMGAAWVLELLDATGVVLSQAAGTDAATAVIVEYPTSPPGMTWTQALNILLDEAAARAGSDPLAVANLLERDFTDTDDTASATVPVVADMATKVGTTLLTFLRELSATYLDFDVNVNTSTGAPRLQVWIKGTRGSTPGVTYERPTDPEDESTGNLISKTRIGEA